MRDHTVPGAVIATVVGVASLLAAQPAALGAGSKIEIAKGSTVGVRPAVPGNELWAARSPAGRDAAAVGVSPDGSTVFVTGRGRSSHGPDYVTGAYDASTGAKLWGRRYNGPGNSYDIANALGVSPDGSTVFVTGDTTNVKSLRTSGLGSTDYATVAYDAATGAQLWSRRYNGPEDGYDSAGALGVSPDGSTVFVTGESDGQANFSDFATVAYDTATGATAWVRRYDGPGSMYDLPRALQVSPDGLEVFVAGSSDGPSGDYEYTTVAYDSITGQRLWVRRYGMRGGVATALGASPDGSTVFATGWSVAQDGSRAYATVAYDAATGDAQWVTRYTGSEGGLSEAAALGVSPDGSKVFVTGYDQVASGPSDYVTVSYDASTGGELWAQRYDGPRGCCDVATDVAVGPDGSTVFVTGSSGRPAGADYATIAYDASTGGQLWTSRYNGPDDRNDSPTALEVSPDGSMVFVTGSSWRAADPVYATVAYGTN